MDRVQDGPPVQETEHQLRQGKPDIDPATVQGARDAVEAHGVRALIVNDLTADDLSDIVWSGGETHVESVAKELAKVASGEVEYLAVRAPNGKPIAKGCINYTEHEGAGTLTQLATVGGLQGLGVGSRMIAVAEDRIRQRGLTIAMMGVEENNPRAQALYERLGYRPTGREKESWIETDQQGKRFLYETEVTLLSKELGSINGHDNH
jgi:ribosomal protein S18 acetylase RimI-like enzyme